MAGICEAADGTPIHFQVRGRGLPVYVCHGGPHATFSYLQEALRPLEQRCALVYHD